MFWIGELRSSGRETTRIVTQYSMDLALFDFDGTITTHDTFRPFLSFAGGRVRMALGTALLGPMVVGYELGWIAIVQEERDGQCAFMRVVAQRLAFSCHVSKERSD